MDVNLQERVRRLQHKFHSPFDFGDGITTKPWHVRRRFARRQRLLRIPDVTGKTVLDVGAWDGYFSFELERLGAKRVMAIDVWDEGASEAFLLAREHFNSKVEYRRLDAHKLSPDLIGTFDLVLCAGLLYHLRHPLHGLERIRSVTGEQPILETASLIPAIHEWVPYITFFPGDNDTGKYNSWHEGGFPTKQWVIDALQSVGFKRSEVIYTPSFRHLKKTWALCTNVPGRGRLIVHAFV
jgi:tRNA (mo5U34)-methyltransferase